MEEQMINGLPKDWGKAKLGEICEIVSGNTPKGLEQVSNTGKYQFYKVSDMNLTGNETSMTTSNLRLTEEEMKRLRIKVYPKGTVIFPKRGGAILTNKKRILSEPSSFDLNVMGVLPNKNVESAFLYYWFQKLDLTKIYDGSNVPQINNKNIAPLEFPLPAKEVQQQIVSKIEELFSELDKCIDELKTAQQQLKVYRQAVLKWAFEGKLTNENVTDGALPETWAFEKHGNIAKKKTIKALPTEYPEAKFIGMDCIEPHTLKPSFLYDFIEFKSAGNYFKANQVLYGRMRPYLNKVYRAEFDGVCSGEFIILDCGELFNPDLLKYILHSRGFVSFANSITTGDRPRISYEEISNYDIPLPSLEEQQQIVQEIESRLSVCDKIEETITASLKQSAALRQSILKKAFEGNLF